MRRPPQLDTSLSLRLQTNTSLVKKKTKNKLGAAPAGTADELSALSPPQTVVIMGCACCKQKKSAKAAVTSLAVADVADLSPGNVGGGLSSALTQGRYCPDPTQTIPDFNKGFSSSAIFSSTQTHQRPGVITSRVDDFLRNLCRWMDGWVDRWMDGWMVDRWMDGWVDGCTINGWMDIGVDGWMGRF